VTIFREKYRFTNRWVRRGALGGKLLRYIIFLITAAFRLNKLHLRNHYDSVQVHNLPDFQVFCALIPKLQGVPIILDLHDLMPEFYAGRFGSTKSLPAQLIRLQERLACCYADNVITVSEHWRQALIQRGVPTEKCDLLMNVTDERIFHPLKGQHSIQMIKMASD
jgi:hypothetical protein